jgi:hypothetical protein
MAAQERTKQAQTKTEPPKPEIDLLSDFDTPSTTTAANNLPPAFDTSFLPPQQQQEGPPSFQAMEEQINFPPPPPMDAIAPPPPAMMMRAPAAPSAPCFEDLLDSQQQQQQHTMNPLAGMHVVPPPAAPPAPIIDEDVLGALDPAEREALLEEQRQIMEQIEKEKSNNQASSSAARAMAFDLRSNTAVAEAAAAMDRPSSRASPPSYSSTSASGSKSKKKSSGRTVDLGAGEQVPLHGQERTKQAIKDGTAVLVQCINCQNWMQVTDNASLMFCPVCQVVSPIEKEALPAGDTAAADGGLSQMDADMKLAEQLQREEYAGGNRERAAAPAARAKAKKEAAEDGQSWYDWMVGTPKAGGEKPAATTPTRPQQQPEHLSRGQVGVSRPPGSGLVSASTGEEAPTISYGNSYDEQQGLMGSASGRARVAEQKSMFACVADSITTAATTLTATNLAEDQEGNVHGVDSSSLLAMPQVSRQRD